MVVILLCIMFVDRPVERVVERIQDYKLLFDLFASPSLLPLPLSIMYCAFYAVATVCGWEPGPKARLALTVSLATMAANAAKDELKWMFGRPWPTTWMEHGTYAFHPFVNGDNFGGFPSGHTTYISTPLLVLWHRMPQYRAFWGGLIGTVMVGLVGCEAHFVGDTLGGLALGYTAARAALVVEEKGAGRKQQLF